MGGLGKSRSSPGPKDVEFLGNEVTEVTECFSRETDCSAAGPLFSDLRLKGEISKHEFFLLETDLMELQAVVDLGYFSFTVVQKRYAPRRNRTLDSEC